MESSKTRELSQRVATPGVLRLVPQRGKLKPLTSPKGPQKKRPTGYAQALAWLVLPSPSRGALIVVDGAFVLTLAVLRPA